MVDPRRKPRLWPVLGLWAAVTMVAAPAAAKTPLPAPTPADPGKPEAKPKPGAKSRPKATPKKATPNKPTPSKRRSRSKTARWGHADCDFESPIYEHAVQPGEHLGLIAGRYGVRRTDLVALNPTLSDPDLIRPGQAVRVCPKIAPRLREKVVHEIRTGDTLGEIAAQYGLTIDELIGFQDGGIKNPNVVRVGQPLTIWVDKGVLPAFIPPPPPKKRGGRGHARVRVRLPDDGGYHIKRPHLAFGTAKTIGLLTRAIGRYRQGHRGAPKVHVGDISKRGGGKLRPHLSHRRGRDVDLGYVLTGADAHRTRFSGVTSRNLDRARTWALVKSLLDTQQVQVIFMDYQVQRMLYEYAKDHGVRVRELDELFQYPRGPGRPHGSIRHWRSHRNHFHVRFRK